MTTAAEFVQRVVEVSKAVGWQAGVGASETAGHIISVLAGQPDLIDRFMAEGTELFIDGTMRPENGTLTYLARNGSILSPAQLRAGLGIEN